MSCATVLTLPSCCGSFGGRTRGRGLQHQQALIAPISKELIAQRAVAIVIGAGFSMHLSGDPVTTWIGFLRYALARCRFLNLHLDEGWFDWAESRIASGESAAAIEVYVEIKAKLPPGEIERLYDDAFGKLRIKRPAGARALAAWGCPIITTNFDTLIERITGLESATWRRPGLVQEVLSGLKKGVIHVHGIFNDPGTLVMTADEYRAMLDDKQQQAILHGLKSIKAIIFIGCGETLSDPNFSSLFEWSRAHLPGAHMRVYRFARTQDIPVLQQRQNDLDRIVLVPYGATYESLAPFMWALAPRSKRLWLIFIALLAIAASADAWQHTRTPPPFRLGGVVLMGTQPMSETAVNVPGNGPDHLTDKNGYFAYECSAGSSVNSLNVRLGGDLVHFQLKHSISGSSFIELQLETTTANIRSTR